MDLDLFHPETDEIAPLPVDDKDDVNEKVENRDFDLVEAPCIARWNVLVNPNSTCMEQHPVQLLPDNKPTAVRDDFLVFPPLL